MVSSLSNANPSQAASQQTDSSYKAQRMAGVRPKLFVGEAAISIGQIDLLDFIGQTGCLALAAARMDMDEARAESLLALTSAGFLHPLIAPASKGEKTLELTAVGAALIQRYRVHHSHMQTVSGELKEWLTAKQASL